MAIAYEPADGITLMLSADLRMPLDAERTLTLRCLVACAAHTSPNGQSATLQFVLPSQAVVTRHDPAAIELDSLVPGTTRNVERDVYIHAGAALDCALRFEAVVYDGDGRMYRSNVVTCDLARRALLCSAQTCVQIEPSGSAGEISIVAQLYNHGNGDAENITLDVPPPAGTHVSDLRATTSRFARIAPGERQTLHYLACITATDRTQLTISDATVCDAAGNRVTLAPASLEIAAAFATPSLSIESDGRRFGVRIQGTNDGYGVARDVTFAMRWPAGYELSVASLEFNAAVVGRFERLQAFARANVALHEATVIVAAIDAGAGYDLRFDLFPKPDAADGTVEVAIEAAQTRIKARADLCWEPPSKVAARITAQALCAVTAGSQTPFELELANLGNRDVAVNCAVEGASAELRVAGTVVGELHIPAGDRLAISGLIRVPTDRVVLLVAFVVRDASRELARTTTTIRVRPAVIPERRAHWAEPVIAHVGITSSANEPNMVIPPAGSTATMGFHSSASLPAAPTLRTPVSVAAPPLASSPQTESSNDGHTIVFVLELTAARIERSMRLLQAPPPATLAEHVCLLGCFLPTKSLNGSSNVRALLRAFGKRNDTTLDRVLLNLRLPGGKINARQIATATRAPAITLLEAIVADDASSASAGHAEDDVRLNGPYLSVNVTRAQAARALEMLRTTDNSGFESANLALMPSEGHGCAPVGVALAAYVQALQAAPAAAWGSALDQIDAKRRNLAAALIDRRILADRDAARVDDRCVATQVR